MGLGPVAQHSALGQPLRVVVSLIAEPGEDLAAECFRLAPADGDADGIPQVSFGRVSLERSTAGAQLVVSNPRPVNDPVLRLALQAGCDAGVRREYTLLLDPPVIEVPLVAAESAPRSVPEAPARTAARPPARGAGAPARDAARPATAGAPPAQRKAAPSKPRSVPHTTTKRAPPSSDQPRLKLAPAPPASAPGAGAAADSGQAQSQQDSARAIEAETVVLQQRIAELTATIERLQQELKAGEAADRAAAERAAAAAKAPPPPPRAAWWEENWPLLLAIVGLPILIAGALLWKRQRDAEAEEPDWRAGGVVAARAQAPAPRTEAPALRSAAAGVVPPRPEPAPRPAQRNVAKPPAPPGTASALAVSELLQVTEEARVYAALGHPERAIDVLNEHLKRSPKAMPAAWLMLLDLYHATGRRQEFRHLAEEFHVNCNVQTPQWDTFAAGEPGDVGLEAFPHVVRHIVAVWRKPECRRYLERLLHDNREGRRTGFPLGAYSDVLLLLQIGDAPPAIDIDSDLARTGKLDVRGRARASGAGPSA